MKFRCRNKKKWKRSSSSSSRKTNAMRCAYAATTAVNDWWNKSILLQLSWYADAVVSLSCVTISKSIVAVVLGFWPGKYQNHTDKRGPLDRSYAASKDTTTLSWPFPWIEESCLFFSIDIFGRKQMLLFCWNSDHCWCAMCALDFFRRFIIYSVHCSKKTFHSCFLHHFRHSDIPTDLPGKLAKWTTTVHNLRSALSSFISPKNE